MTVTEVSGVWKLTPSPLRRRCLAGVADQHNHNCAAVTKAQKRPAAKSLSSVPWQVGHGSDCWVHTHKEPLLVQPQQLASSLTCSSGSASPPSCYDPCAVAAVAATSASALHTGLCCFQAAR